MALKYGSTKPNKPRAPMTPRQRLASSINFLLFSARGAKGAIGHQGYVISSNYFSVKAKEKTAPLDVIAEKEELDCLFACVQAAEQALINLEFAVIQYNNFRKDGGKES